MVITDSIIKIKVESIAFGGDGIARHEGRVIFIADAMPGEEIYAQLYELRKNFARAKLIKIDKPSLHRRIADCRHFSICGGCQFQHVAYQEQLRVKENFVYEALTRLAALVKPQIESIQASTQEFSYRRHIRLHFNENHLGYMAADGQNIININICNIFDQKNFGFFISLRELINKLSLSGQLSLFKAIDGYVALFDLEKMPAHKTMNEALKNIPELRGIIWRTRYGTKNIGDCQLKFDLDGLKINYSPHAFVQAHAEQSGEIYYQLVKQMRKLKPGRVLDLYCGIGVTSLLIARDGAKVFGIESNHEAIRLARYNATANHIPNLEWSASDVDTLINKVLVSFQPDVVVLNPPRTGLSKVVVSALLSYKPKTIFYISCMPSTLARDIAKLSQAGYGLSYCKPYDMFPQTTHVESLVQLDLVTSLLN